MHLLVDKPMDADRVYINGGQICWINCTINVI